MSDLILKHHEVIGKKLYEDNDNYRNIVNVMEHPEFRKFFDKHFDNWTSTETILMFMKLYQVIEKELKIPLTGYQKIAIIDEIIKDSNKRELVVNRIINWKNEKNIL